MSEDRKAGRSTISTPPRIGTGWLISALLLITIAVFGRIVVNDFTWWDDHETIHQNPHLNPPTLQGLLHYWREPHMGLYVPVTYSFWSAIASAAYLQTPGDFNIRLNPALFHAASLAVHAGSVLLVFGLLRRLAGSEIGAFFGALFFAIHPVQVEPVAWTSGMKDLLYGFFSLLALWLYVIFARESSGRRWAAYAAGTLAFLLALLSKPSAVMAPAIAGLLDYLILHRPARKTLAALAPWFAVSAAFAAITKLVQTASHVEAPALWARPLIALDAIAFYLWKIVAPFALAPDYGRRPDYVIDSGWIWITWIVPLALLCFLWRYGRRATSLVAGVLILIAAVTPLLGLVPFEFQGYSTVADHYLYLGMLGPALVISSLYSRRMNSRKTAIISAVLALFAIVSIAQAGRWQNDSSLWSHTLRVNGRSWLAAYNLGVSHERGRRPHDAGRMYARSVELNGEFLNAREAYASYLVRTRRDREAIEQFEELIRIAQRLPVESRPNSGRQYNGLGEALLRIGKPAEAALAFERSLEALRGGPGADTVRANLERARALLASTRPGGGA